MFSRAARVASRSAFRRASYSTATHAPAPSSDMPWVVGSFLVFAPTIYYLSATAPPAHAVHPVKSQVPKEEAVKEEPVEEEETVEPTPEAVEEPASESAEPTKEAPRDAPAREPESAPEAPEEPVAAKASEEVAAAPSDSEQAAQADLSPATQISKPKDLGEVSKDGVNDEQSEKKGDNEAKPAETDDKPASS
ncbi:hypothetical protein P7C70_g2427, partial [Phenoliferia sp. Uapishka_3]